MDDHINEDLPCYGLYIDGSWVDAEGGSCLDAFSTYLFRI